MLKNTGFPMIYSRNVPNLDSYIAGSSISHIYTNWLLYIMGWIWECLWNNLAISWITSSPPILVRNIPSSSSKLDLMQKELFGVIGDNFTYFYGGKDLRVIDSGIPNLYLGVLGWECYI